MIEGQIKALEDAGSEEIIEDSFSGTKVDRPLFEKLRMKLRMGDILIVTKLDRLARSVSRAFGLITELIDQGVTINVLNLGILSNDLINTPLRKILLAFA